MVTAPPERGKGIGLGKSLDQTLPHLPGEFSPPAALNTPHRGGGADVAAEKGTGCVRLTEFYIVHKISWRNEPKGGRKGTWERPRDKYNRRQRLAHQGPTQLSPRHQHFLLSQP